MRLRSLLQALLLCIGIAGSAQASLNVTIGDSALSPGGTALVDVYASSDVPQQVGAFGFELLITPTSGLSRLEFDNPQPYLDLGSNPDYIFTGNSAGYFAIVFIMTVPNDTLVASDFTASPGSSVLLASGEEKLLGQVAVTHYYGAPGPEGTIGDTFALDLVPTSGDSSDFISYFSNTGFAEDWLNGTGIRLEGPIPFTSTSGQVTIIPEPGQLTIMLGLGGVFLVGSWWRRRKRSARA